MVAFTSFFPDILATIIGGLLLALIFFFLKEKFFPIPAIMGTWRLIQNTELTQYIPYHKMELEYRVLLRIEGSKVFGTLEKVREKSSTGERTYVGEHRSRGLIEGYVEKNIFGKDRVQLHVYERNHKRQSSTLHILTIIKENDDWKLIGEFSSTVANQTGSSTWERII